MVCFICTIRNMTSNVVSSFYYGHDYVNGSVDWVDGVGISTGSYLRKKDCLVPDRLVALG